MTMHVGIEIRNLTKRFGSRCVLDIDALTFEPGCTYALIGANGSGKSTLLRTLSGVSDPTAGTFDFFASAQASDPEAGSLKSREASVGYMPQKSYVFGFTVFKNVLLALEGLELDKDEQTERVNRALEAVGMLEMAESRGSRLSGGEAQRVALARMIVCPHDVLLLDEPTASMDVSGTLQVESVLKTYIEETGCLLIVATHAPSQARRIASRAVMLSDGHVVESGGTSDVLDHPQTDEGREFLTYWKV